MSLSASEENGSDAPSLKDILSDEDLALLFRDFLHQLHSVENLSFYIDVEEYRSISDMNDRKIVADKIWAKYLANNAPSSLNIDAKTRERISSRISSLALDIFDEAQEFAYSLLTYDSYRKFVASDVYSRWLKDEAKKKPKWGWLFGKQKKKVPGELQKTESLLMLQKHVSANAAAKK